MSHLLSRRARELAQSPPLAEYLYEHFARSDDPDYVPLCVAENHSMWDVLVPRLAAYRDVPARVLGYDAMTGALEFRERLAAFMGRAFLGRRFAPEQIAALAGAGAVLEILFWAIADPGDGVLVPTPSYAGFWADLETRDELTIIPVHCRADDGFRLTPELLDRALWSADRPVRALLFTTPNNPLGCVYSRAEVQAVLDWAERADVHVVFDEIYALSVFGERPFCSVASVREQLGERVHVVWAFSKDFGASGLRCGVLVSESEAVMQAVDALAYWSACSGDTAHLLGSLIADRRFCDDYIAQMQARLGRIHASVCGALEANGIPHIRAEAGFFLICDLRGFLTEPSEAAETALWRRILDETKVNLTPGSACRIDEPGFFRLCYASEPSEVVLAGIERIGRLLRR